MPILRFFFGHGWWILWYLAFHLTMLIGVVLILAIFAQELKPAGEKPALASLGSMMVFMIGFGLATVTLVNTSIWTGTSTTWLWYAKAALSIALPVVVGFVTLPLNNWLADSQGYPSFWWNTGVSGVVVVANLVIMFDATN